MSGNNRGQRGFTLLETMIAGAMLTTGVLGLMGMQATAVNASRRGNRSAQALMFADETAQRVKNLPWTTLEGYPQSADSGQPDGFKPISDTLADPSTATPAFAPEGLTGEGAVVSYSAGDAMYQRITQVVGEEVNPSISGIDAMRIKVTVRYRLNGDTQNWRGMSIVVTRAKQL